MIHDDNWRFDEQNGIWEGRCGFLDQLKGLELIQVNLTLNKLQKIICRLFKIPTFVWVSKKNDNQFILSDEKLQKMESDMKHITDKLSGVIETNGEWGNDIVK